MKPKLLIVDDDEEIRTQMKWALTSEYEVTIAGDRAEALAAFRSLEPAATLLDLGLPPNPNSTEEGMAILSGLRAADSEAKVIVVSGQGDRKNAIEAVGAGAWDFLCKPVEIDELRLLLRRCLYVADLEKSYHDLQLSSQANRFEGMWGQCQAMRDVFAFIRKLATNNAPVLILGKSGTGKEITAQAIHRQSACKDGPFVAINCNALTESLLESELFGHEKGSFTGANAQRKGLIESASGGTLFLDEIGEMPLPIQIKLLRFLQERTFRRVGGTQEIRSDARVVAATNALLKDMVAAKTFREDLYFRLAVFVVELPPLSERGEDVLIVAKELLAHHAAQAGKKGLSFGRDALSALLRHSWPGNIRELQNRVQRAVVMADGKRITAADMELEEAPDHGVVTLKEARENVEREMIVAALRRNRANISAAAVELGISRPTLYELMEKLGIPRE
ncbi:MAG TPA: PEP-CTERM-box response regulator transcription factor [Verrucomicrobiales bacterium]|nr:PEP-CTERM-box response regulator transcription factor [Verrucomicrobiales bacterium]